VPQFLTTSLNLQGLETGQQMDLSSIWSITQPISVTIVDHARPLAIQLMMSTHRQHKAIRRGTPRKFFMAYKDLQSQVS
tara:strand:+ start:35 stop:271 length:237 start_codon:yes stop_codon:yes gene_type:complete